MKHETFGTRSIEFILSTLALVAAVVRKMLKTLVTLGNIFRVLLNLTKRLIFVTFKDSSPLSIFTQLTFIFSFVHELRLLLTLAFVTLPYLFG